AQKARDAQKAREEITVEALPRRRPNEQSAAGSRSRQPGPPDPPSGPTEPVDPEAIRTRLSALAEGVSAAMRRGNPPNSAKDR
ncbi:MAG: hypothetical protein QOE03_2269, partial [Micromonosporaceae bacterium]|nr:hypothetical protein [Micromonosporaceae bacterium]